MDFEKLLKPSTNTSHLGLCHRKYLQTCWLEVANHIFICKVSSSLIYNIAFSECLCVRDSHHSRAADTDIWVFQKSRQDKNRICDDIQCPKNEKDQSWAFQGSQYCTLICQGSHFPNPLGFYKMIKTIGTILGFGHEDISLLGKVNSSKNRDLDMDLSLDSKIKDMGKSYRITYQ